MPIDAKALAELLKEAAAVLDRVRTAHPDCWEKFKQRDFLVDELEGIALMLLGPRAH